MTPSRRTTTARVASVRPSTDAQQQQDEDGYEEEQIRMDREWYNIEEGGVILDTFQFLIYFFSFRLLMIPITNSLNLRAIGNKKKKHLLLNKPYFLNHLKKIIKFLK